MKTVRTVTQSIAEKIEVITLYCFIFSATLSIRKVLFFYPIGGKFNEYSGIFLYLSDVFFVLLLVLWAIRIFHNTNYYLSINSTFTGIIGKINLWITRYPQLIRENHVSFILSSLVLLAFISISWSDNSSIASYRSFKLLEFFIFYLYLKSVTKKTIANCSTWNNAFVNKSILFKNTSILIIIIGIINSLVGFFQFVSQKSLGLRFIGESIISPRIDGVAKILFDGEKFIRAYGLFPHPNVLGGFLLFSIILTAYFSIMFHVEHSQRRYLKIALFIQTTTLILTFSKSAIFGLLASTVFINVSRVTLLDYLKRMFHVEHLTKFILIIGITILILNITQPDYYSFITKSYQERSSFNISAYSVISQHTILGVGNGNFVNQTWLTNHNLEYWQYQPVHNVFLLIFCELGVGGILLFIFLLYKLLTIVPRGTIASDTEKSIVMKSILFGLLISVLFDHYLWDIQQGQLIFWLLVGLISQQENA